MKLLTLSLFLFSLSSFALQPGMIICAEEIILTDAKEIPKYENTAEALKEYISEAQFKEFYRVFNSCIDAGEIREFLKYSHSSTELTLGEATEATFFIKSPEITPAISGFVAYNVKHTDKVMGWGGGLVAYFPVKD